MRRRLIPVNVVIAFLLFVLLGLEPDRHVPPVAVMDRGEELFLQQCAGCHGDNGKQLNADSSLLLHSKWVMGPGAHLIKFLVSDSVKPVKGYRFHKNIAAYTHLSDQQMADVLTYVRYSFGNSAKPVTSADIRKGRAIKK